MRHLYAHTSSLKRRCIAGATFYLDPAHEAELATLLDGYFSAVDKPKTLDEEEEHRGVYLLEGQHQWVLKRNRLVQWKKQLQNYLGIRRGPGLVDLTSEFVHLSLLARKAACTPRVAAFGHRARFPFLHEEYLLVGFYVNHRSVDECMRADPEAHASLLPRIFGLFQTMLGEGFVHMDPHPKNILIAPDGTLKLIDFECCAQSVIDADFSLGLLLGYFYRYWFQRFVSLELYHQACMDFLQAQGAALDHAVFMPVYLRFRDHKVSRSTRYQVLLDAAAQRAFIAQCLLPA